jgi:CubicO group peptidase (beta-lactamase class C family)
VNRPHTPLRHDDTVSLQTDLERLAEERDFSGVIGLSRNGDRFVELARGLADRANGRPMPLDTRFGIASATKGMTALAVAGPVTRHAAVWRRGTLVH